MLDPDEPDTHTQDTTEQPSASPLHAGGGRRAGQLARPPQPRMHPRSSARSRRSRQRGLQRGGDHASGRQDHEEARR